MAVIPAASFPKGYQPFGKLVKFGGVDFNGPGGPINTNIDWPSAPISLIDSAYPSDPFTNLPATNTLEKATFSYGLIAIRRTTSEDPSIPQYKVPNYPLYRAHEQEENFIFYTPLQAIEYQWNFIYMWLRQHDNQSSHLITDSANSDHAYAYARARIEKLDLAMTPGKDTNSYVTNLGFVLLDAWAPTDPNSNIINTNIPDRIIGDVHVPFGNLLSFNGVPFSNTLIPGNPTIPTTVVQNYLVEWSTQYKILPHKPYPLDLFGVSPCPLKPITAEWEILFKADTPGAGYYNVYQQYNSFLLKMQTGNQRGQLVCTDSWGNIGTCTARLKSFPLTLTPMARTHYIAKLTFNILSDWNYTPASMLYSSVGQTNINNMNISNPIATISLIAS